MLCEAILAWTDPVDIVKAKSVCKNFSAVTESSTVIKQKLFLVPGKLSPLWAIVIEGHKRMVMTIARMMKMKSDGATFKLVTLVQPVILDPLLLRDLGGVSLSHCVERLLMTDGLGRKWHRDAISGFLRKCPDPHDFRAHMFLTSPPFTHAIYYVIGVRDTVVTVENTTGLKCYDVDSRGRWRYLRANNLSRLESVTTSGTHMPGRSVVARRTSARANAR